MDTVSKFGLVFYSEAQQAAAGLRNMQAALGQMNSSLVGMAGMADAAYTKLKGGLLTVGETLIGTAAKIESTRGQFEFAFRDMGSGAADVFDKVQDAGLRMVQTTDEVVSMTTMLKRMGSVNIFDDRLQTMMDSIPEAKQQGLQFIDVLGDMASLNPFGAFGVARALTSGMTGQWQSFAMRLDLSMEQVKGIRKEVDKAVGPTAKLAAMAPFLTKQFGGASLALAETWGFLSRQIGDIQDKLYSTLGQPMLDRLKKPLASLIKFFVDPKDGLLSRQRIQQLQGVKNVFGDIGDKVARFARFVGSAAAAVIKWTVENPAIIRMAAAIASVATGIAGAVAGMIALKIATTTLLVAASTFTTTFLPFAAFAGILGTAVFLTAKWAVHADSLSDMFEKWGIIFSGVSQIVQTMNGDYAKLNAETEKSASEKGILGVMLKLGVIAFKVKSFFVGIVDTLKENWTMIAGSFTPAIERLRSILGLSSSTTSDWAEHGKTVGNVLTGVITTMAKVLDKAIAIGQTMWDWKGAILALGIAWKANDLLGGRPVNMLRNGLSGFTGGGGVKGAAAAAVAGGQRVFVTNWPLTLGTAGAGGVGGAAAAAGATSKLGKVGQGLSAAGNVLGAGAAGYAFGSALDYAPKLFGAERSLGEMLGDFMWNQGDTRAGTKAQQESFEKSERERFARNEAKRAATRVLKVEAKVNEKVLFEVNQQYAEDNMSRGG